MPMSDALWILAALASSAIAFAWGRRRANTEPPPERLMLSWPEPLVRLGAGGRLEELNGAAAALVGRPVEELVGARLSELEVHWLGGCKELVESVRSTGEAQRWYFETKEGGRRFHALAQRVGEGVVCALRDVTELCAHKSEAEQLQREQALLLRELDHRVKNNLASLQGLLSLEEERLQWASQLGLDISLEGLRQRVRALALSHEVLSGQTWGDADLKVLCSQVVRAAYEAAPLDMRLDLQVEGCGVRLVSRAAQHLTLVLYELVNNTFKHAVLGRAAAGLRQAT